MSSSNKVIDTLKKDELFQVAQKLNLLVAKSIKKEELKSLIINKLLNNDSKFVFPKVPIIIAIGDLHGDLEATIKALKLGGVISKTIPNNTRDINKINWIGGRKVVVQLGDQIDRVRPNELINDLCPENDSELVRDEGSDLKIMLLFSKLAGQAQKTGGAVYSILGNHELMNVDGDFRYVSPKEFREFGNYFKEKHSEDKSLPYGFYSRKNAFTPGGSIAKHLASNRYSVLVVGSWLFVHGGISKKCASKYLLKDINKSVKNWLNGDKTPQNKAYIEAIYHCEDDENSPFWSRIFSDLDEWDERKSTVDFNHTIHILNKNNKTNIKGMIVGHSPQFMYDKPLNGSCNNKLWRVDVGMSRAFGECDTKNRKVQILVIKNDNEFFIVKED
tara:strand:+ start:348 stop:1511 length:1164 start_codon:yes stop_codon:yes gene_type:complete